MERELCQVNRDPVQHTTGAALRGRIRETAHDACIVPWPAFRQILAWYGGGPFIGVTLIADSGTPRLADPVKFELVIPHPSKQGERICFELCTRNLMLTVREVVAACLADGDARLVPHFGAGGVEKDGDFAIAAARERIIKLIDAQYELDTKAAGGAAAAGDAAMQSSALPAVAEEGAAAAAACSSATAVPRTGDWRLDRLVVVSAGRKEYDGDIITDLDVIARTALPRVAPFMYGSDSDVRHLCIFEPYRIVPRRHDPNAHPLDNVSLISRILSFFPAEARHYEQQPSLCRGMLDLVRLRKVSKYFRDAIENHCASTWKRLLGCQDAPERFHRFIGSLLRPRSLTRPSADGAAVRHATAQPSPATRFAAASPRDGAAIASNALRRRSATRRRGHRQQRASPPHRHPLAAAAPASRNAKQRNATQRNALHRRTITRARWRSHRIRIDSSQQQTKTKGNEERHHFRDTKLSAIAFQ